MPPIADSYELDADRFQVFHCFGVLVSRPEPSLGDCHKINVGINDMVSENVVFIATEAGRLNYLCKCCL